MRNSMQAVQGFRSALLAAALAAAALPAGAQEQPRPVTPDRPTMSDFGKSLSASQAGGLLAEMGQLADEAIAASRAAETAGSVAEVKAGASRVLEAVWGQAPGVSGAEPAEVARLGWKERWQVSGDEFDANFVRRLGAQPPRITDPRALGMVGRGRAVRGHLEELVEGEAAATGARREAAEATLASLNDVIGWTHITRGYKGREVQPRISLTHEWDAPPAFWNSTADTGWLFEAEAQAINIVKTDYGTDIAEARQHAAAMTELLQRVKEGVDANRNGTVEAVRMEGGLNAALAAAARAGLQSR
ncbi:MAG TPA: hypothetical protein VFZ18_08655 [Longimicrobiaceae bacterium]